MMGFNFPNAPNVNDAFIPAGGPQYVWDGEKWEMVGTTGISVTADAYNRIVNGAHQIAQEQASTTVSQTYAIDQWQLQFNGGAYTLAQVTSTAVGAPMKNRLQLLVNTAVAAPTGNNYAAIVTPIEGNRVSDLRWIGG